MGWLLLVAAAGPVSAVAQTKTGTAQTPAGTAQAGMAGTSLQQAMLRANAPVVPLYSTEEPAAASPATSVASALQQIAAQAGVVFTGSVAAVNAEPGGPARVVFQVERGIRGVVSGAGYTMHVSAWGGGADRFYPGERALFLLTAPTVAGFSAPVMGERGIVPLTGDALVGNLDLRWVAADVERGAPFTNESVAVMHASSLPSPTTAAEVNESSSPSGSAVNSSSLMLPDVHAIDRDLVLDLLHSATSGTGQARS